MALSIYLCGAIYMCGIGGCVAAEGESVPLDRLTALRDAMLHRGPDGSGIEVVDNVGLVHTRLAIIDVSEQASQPMRHPDGRWWLAYNGEIYNHKALRDHLGGPPPTSDGDTATLLSLLAARGTEGLSELNGQFAFAALDLHGRALYLVRDRFGIKPLYLAREAGTTWFASEPGALVAAGLEARPDQPGWPGLVDGSYYRGDKTLLAGTRRLLPGTLARVDLATNAVSVQQWISTARHVSSQRQDELKRPRRSMTDRLEGTLRSAVHSSMLSDVPIGTMCSGGLDSSLVTALAAEVKPDLVAFAASYGGGTSQDEGPAARRVAGSLGIEADVFEVTEQGWRSGFVPATVHFGEPLHNASSVVIAQIAERARQRGIKVLLTGEGADELFGGYYNYAEPPLRRFLFGYPLLLRASEDLLAQEPRRLLRQLTRPRSSQRRSGQRSDWDPTSFVGRFGHEPYDDTPENLGVGDAYASHDDARRKVETRILMDFDRNLSHLLCRMDKNMMQVSVEARVPFLDPRVVELALNLPLEYRLLPWNKGILRDVARRHLPLSIAYRRKIRGMIFDAGEWVEAGANPAFLSEGLFRDLFAIPAPTFQELVATASSTQRMRLWSTEVWCRSVFAGEPAPTIEKELWPQGA
ncbi:MAG TPA: asparagine synthase (glutamine-hydrolyzing) [Acidimicrobiales bacterium]|nr:asparagine synthase (glutamine-hydrolyzing) [Acidimicrobiales bacterium]